MTIPTAVDIISRRAPLRDAINSADQENSTEGDANP